MRPWLSGIMSPCQGLVGSSILPGRTKKKDLQGSFFDCGQGRSFVHTKRCAESKSFCDTFELYSEKVSKRCTESVRFDSPWPHPINQTRQNKCFGGFDYVCVIKIFLLKYNHYYKISV